MAVNGFWGGRSQRCFVDVCVFNPFAPSNNSTSLVSTFKKHENIKSRAYGQCVREVEHALFIPIVLATTGGLGHEATIFISIWVLCCPQSGDLITPRLWAGLDVA